MVFGIFPAPGGNLPRFTSIEVVRAADGGAESSDYKSDLSGGRSNWWRSAGEEISVAIGVGLLHGSSSPKCPGEGGSPSDA